MKKNTTSKPAFFPEIIMDASYTDIVDWLIG
jgi:hypothetical protein